MSTWYHTLRREYMADILKKQNDDDVLKFIDTICGSLPARLTFSIPGKDCKYRKCTAKQTEKGYYIERLTEKQAFHENIAEKGLRDFILKTLEDFDALTASCMFTEYSIKRTKSGKFLTNKKKRPGTQGLFTGPGQNRGKNYLIPEGTVLPALVEMGVMTEDGHLIKAMSDKYRQINRFLEIIDDVIKDEGLSEISIVDFGCGKSYLTFIVYYYFAELRHINVRMTGVDLKADVIAHCNELSQKYGYKGLKFVVGDIADYESEVKVDMVLSLHACDTATDYALFNAIRWNSRYIFSVPCCQHEVAKQADFSSLPVFKEYGLMTERISALLTDSVRAQLLTANGYRTQVMEFVDLCHTPKNILLRCKKADLAESTRKKAVETVKETCRQFGIRPTLTKLLEVNIS